MMKYTVSKVKDISDQLLNWMESEAFRGWDPFDGLNSPFLGFSSYLHRWLGVAALQLVKRSPVNLRPILLIPKTINSKGIGLVLATCVNRYKLWNEKKDLLRSISLAEWLLSNHSRGYRGIGWGYPFDWANRAFFAPKGTPTIVGTSFIGHALLDLYELTGERKWMDTVISSCEFICEDLNRTFGKAGFCFSYTPLDSSQVHNANLLGASLIARVGAIEKRSDLLECAKHSAIFTMNAQNADGSWFYGCSHNQQWIDSFHSGYNLVSLKVVNDHLANEDVHFKQSIRKALAQGKQFYIDNFFLQDGTVKYFHHSAEPLDAHAFAHAIICIHELRNINPSPTDLIDKILHQLISFFWSGRGYFYWQIKGGRLNRMPCMRWVEAWVLLGLSAYLVSKSKLNDKI